MDVILYTPTYGNDRSNGPESWSRSVPFPTTFHLIHDAKLLKEMNNGGRDMVLIAPREGVVALWADVTPRLAWRSRVVGNGLPQSRGNPYWGSGSVDVARVGNDAVGYIVACEVSIFRSCRKMLYDVIFRPSTETVCLFT